MISVSLSVEATQLCQQLNLLSQRLSAPREVGLTSCPCGNLICGATAARRCQNPCWATGVVCPALSRPKLRHSETASNRGISAVVPLICPVAAWSLLTQHWGTSAAWVSFSPRFDQRVMGWGGCSKPGACCSDCISAG